MAKTALDRFVDELLEGDSKPHYIPWPCPQCGRPAVIDDVFLGLDGERTLTIWRCEPCQTVGVTPHTLREPPVWVPAKEQ